MPDQYDPRVTPRSTNGHRQADPRRGGAGTEDDPLAELAKIVHGRPGTATAPAVRGAARPSGEGGLDDLEAELLNDLQASFAAVRDSQPPRPPISRPRVVEPEAIFTSPSANSPFTFPAPVEPPRAPRQDAPPPPRMEPRVEPRAESRIEPQLRDEFRPEPFDDSRFVPIPPPPVIQPTIQQTVQDFRPAERFIERRAERPIEPQQEEPVEPMPRVLRPEPVSEGLPNVGNFQMRPTAPVASQAPTPPLPPPPLQPPARQPHSRWEKPEPLRPQPASSSSRFAPPRAAAQPMADDADLDPFAEGGLFAEQAETEDEFPLDGLGMVPGYGEDENLPPYPDDNLDALVRRRRPTRNLIVVATVLALAVVGGISFAMFGPSGPTTGAPPLIAADGGPTKITPEDTAAADTDAQNKLIYDRVNSGEAAANNDTTLVTPGDGPITDVATDDTGNNAISRVIIPGGPGIDAPPTDDALRLDNQQDAVAPPVAAAAPADSIAALAASDAANPDAVEPIGPRKVRTVVVKPDGTIVSSNATDEGAPPADGTAAPATATTVAEAAPAPVAPAPASVNDDTAAIAGNGGKDLPITDAPDASTTTGVASAEPPLVADPPPTQAVEAKPLPLPKPPAETKVATVEATNPDTPIDLSKNARASASTNGGTLVQISSQKSEQAARATYHELQTRYPNILGRYDVNIQRADVPDRGTFYRVRVGPFSAGDAQRLCDDLKSAGGDCVLAKR